MQPHVERVQMKLAFKETSKEVYSVILKDLSSFGSFPFYGIAIIGFLLLNDLAFAKTLFLSLVIVTVVVAAIRLAHFKPRPGQKAKKYGAIYERIDNSSFPSIHAARSVMISFALISKMPVFTPLAALLILAVCLSRLHFKRHDTKDLAVGLIVGYALSLLFF